MRQTDFQIAIWKEGKLFVSQCLNVDIASFGKTKKSALKNMEEALELYFEDGKKKTYKKVEQLTVVALNVAHA